MASTSPALQPAQFGVIGLGVMGANLALNVEDHGYGVVVWNHTPARVKRLLAQQGTHRRLLGAETLEEFARALAPPRRILLMVKAGDPVDQMLDRLASLLSPGDVVTDGGNSFFRDTQRREAAMRARGISFVGMGVSGGEEGARYGPSLMPGGTRPAYDLLRPVLEAIAAGCPLVVSDIPAYTELLNAESAVVVESDNIQETARAIREVLQHPEAAASRAERARLCIASFTPENVAGALDVLYDAL